MAKSLRFEQRFETGDERYGWLNNGVFVAAGRLLAGAVAYEVFRAA